MAKRHLRVTRWDQRGKVMYVDGTSYVDVDASTAGVIPAPTNGKAILLEYGVTVTFSLAGTGAPRAASRRVGTSRPPWTPSPRLAAAR